MRFLEYLQCWLLPQSQQPSLVGSAHQNHSPTPIEDPIRIRDDKLPDQMFYNTGIYTYIWLLTNNKPASRKGKVKIIDARKQFDKEPKLFGNKRNRILDQHRQWIEERYHSNVTDNQQNYPVKIFRNQDFAYHKVSVVFWQTDEDDQPAYLTEPYQAPV